MRKKIAMAALLLAATPMVAAAQAPGFYAGVGGGLNKVWFPHESGEKLGYNITGMIGYDFVGPMVELEGAYRRNDIHSVGLHQYTGMVNALYEFNPQARWAFHVGLGVGFDVLSATQNGNSAEGTHFAAQALIGMRFKFTNNVFLRTDLKAMNVFASGSDLQNFGGTVTLGMKF